MRNGGQSLNVTDVELGIAQGLRVQSLGLGADGLAQAVEVVGIHKLDGDAQPRQRVVEEVVGSTI